MALYHKHRPQSWAAITGQETVVTTIQNQIKKNAPAHAYLLSGPRGTGKTTTARLLAKSLNCLTRKSGESEPCNTCTQCVAITQGSALDVIEIDAASNTGVDTVREVIIENAQFQPTHSQYKIFIIDEVHMLSTSAFNALLKTLEEPPAKTIFILATTELQKLPATILSRCQRYAFKKIPRDLMAARLQEIMQAEGVTASPETIHRLVRASEGSARDAVSLLDQVIATGGTTVTEETLGLIIPLTPFNRLVGLAQLIAKREAGPALSYCQTLATDGIHSLQFLTDLTGFWRGILLYHFNPAIARTELDIGSAQEAEIKELVAAFSPSELLRLLDLTQKRFLEAKYTAIPELPLELLVIETVGVSAPTIAVGTPITPPPVVATPITPPKTEPIVPSTPVIPVVSTPITTELPKNSEPPAISVTIPVAPPEPVGETATAHETALDTKKSFTKADVEKIWPEFMRGLETSSPSVVFLLRSALLGEVTDNILTLTVPYDFHRDKLTERNSKKNLEDLLSGLLKTRLSLNVAVVAAAPPPPGLDDLAAAFGGSVV